MLLFEPIYNNQDIDERLKSTDVFKETWIIPDLRTKLSIQQFFLEQRGSYPEDSILRASDLWKKILFRAKPELSVLSQHALTVHLRTFISLYGKDLQLPPQSEKILLKWMQDWAPIYYHPEGENHLNELTQKDVESASTWKMWWLRSKAAFRYLESKNIVGHSWVSACLQNLKDLNEYWDRDLILDLGGQLTSLEAGHFQQLSKGCQVVTLEPHLHEHSQYGYWLRPYEELSGFAQKKVPKKRREISSEQNVYKHDFPSSLAGIRWLTSSIRQILDSKIHPHKVGVVVPDLEKIWPVLEFHLKTEGIPYHRDSKVNLHSLLESQIFFSRLRAVSRNLSSRDFEVATFSGEEGFHQALSVAKFQAYFKNLYDELDYKRHLSAFENLMKKDHRKEALNVDEFLIASLNYWLKSDLPDWLENILKSALSDFQSEEKLSWTDWVVYAEGVVSSQEKNLSEGHPDGIQLASLNSCHFFPVEYLFAFDMSEQNLRGPLHRGMTSQTVNSLGRNLGFWLEDREQNIRAFELSWLLQNDFKEIHLVYSHVDLQGDLQTPSEAWLRTKSKVKSNKDQIITVLDSLMKIENDEPSAQNLEKTPELFLSPSSFESFVNCPFVFFARHWMGLQSFPEIDLDIDPRDKGQFIHKLFERLLKQEILSGDLQIDWDHCVDEIARELNWALDVHLWKSQKQKYIRLGKRFIDYEREWRKKYPLTQGSRLEVKWQGNYQGVNIRGQIDRIDMSPNKDLILIDYKNSNSGLKGIQLWRQHHQYQMFFYILAIKNQWIPDLEGELKAALYYIVRDFTRNIGWESSESVPGFFEPAGSQPQRMDLEDLQKELLEFEKEFSLVLEKMKSGLIEPKPRDTKDCVKCDWRKACRAPHLI